MHRILSATIWARGAIPASEAKYATPLKRFALPVFDLLAVLAGLKAVKAGIPAFEQSLPGDVADALGYLFAAVAAACFIGVVFPRLGLVEMIAKILLFSLLGIYFLCLISLGESGGTSREFVSIIVLMAMVVPPFRLWILGTESRDRRRAAAEGQV